MAKRRRGKKKNSLFSLICLILAAVIVTFCKVGYDASEDNKAIADVTDDIVKVHFIDVGQGSSTLIQCGNQGILIDTGESEYASTVINYIKNSGVKKLKYVIASHPHSDHIGCMAKVLDSVPTENIIMPEIADNNLPTTSCYLNLLKSIDRNNINAEYSSYGKNVQITNVSVTMYGPVVQDDNLNNMSVLCKVNANGTKFIIPGDAEKAEIRSIMAKNPKLSCDVMAMAHHGSSTSLNKEYLDSTGFKVAVISCGKGNSYGHPHKEILQYLNQNKKEIYRTDKQGSIVFDCSKDGYKITTEK